MARALVRVADHRSPLLRRDPVEMLAQGPGPSLRSGRAGADRRPERVDALTGELRPGGADELRVMRVARAGLGDPEDVLVEVARARDADATGVARVADLDAVDERLRVASRGERPQGPLAHRER